MDKIEGFKGEFRFLSNFWPADVFLDDTCYSSVEHAYQAAKTIVPEERESIRRLITAGEAKKAGRNVTMRPDWDDVKLEVMYDLNKQKFFRDPDLRTALLETAGVEIEETNYWGDVFWGVCAGKGENHLGKILMRIRGELLYLEESMGVSLRNHHT